ncbi:beta-N-acetylhexosaminidase [Paenibacillus oryzisoli]|uniref:beta-N-acetylhexosaminidase n=1 Tax=Paenibacillus oryzisoli TaxID=1850517 RepID=UPI003D2A3D37
MEKKASKITRSAGWLTALSLLSVLTGCSASQKPAASASPQPSAIATATPLPSTSPSPSVTPSPSAKPTPTPDPWAGWTLDDKIGQLIIAGIDGTTVTDQTRELITKYHLGGILLYKPNVTSTKQLVALTNEIKMTNRVNKQPLWLGADEEGGRVTRLPDELVKTPTSQAIGQSGKLQLARDTGALLGKEMAAYGFNMDFAPVLDVNSNPKNPVIGDRSFGAKPALVSDFGVGMMKGIQGTHVVPVVKHFPGHGDTSVDSHVGLPVVQNDLTRLRQFELVPFAKAIAEGADSVMVAHILLPKIDPNSPASMSSIIMTDLLRKEMKFQGVIMTDDLTMGAITEHQDIGDAAVQSVLAGANQVMAGHGAENVIRVFQALHAAVDKGTLPVDVLNERLSQIVQLKRKYALQNNEVPVPDLTAFNKEAQRIASAVHNK